MSNSNSIHVVILAAGQGTRMRSAMPKVLHPIGGKPMLRHVIDTARELKPRAITVVYGHGGEQVKQTITEHDLNWVEQAEQLGTGHAVMQAMNNWKDNDVVLVLYGDVPLIEADTLAEVVRKGSDSFGLLTVHLENPSGYGRIVRDEHARVVAIVEEKDASQEQKFITEVNTGILATNGKQLKNWLDKLDNDNAQKEYYLTDIISMSVRQGITVETIHPDNEYEVAGVNSRIQLAELEGVYQELQVQHLMTHGVSFQDPGRFDLRGSMQTGQDIFIDSNVVFEGDNRLGSNIRIGANCVIRNATIEDDVEILPMSVIEDAVVGKGSRVGPFARLRPGAKLKTATHIGNFVEIKNSEIGDGSKVNHLSYIGDTTMGSGVNIGAGTITANYDGANKHRTVIEDNASTGSHSVMVAPVKVGKGATLGAGTVLTADAPEGQLTLARVKQKSIKGWKRPTKKPGK
ncbi:MAG: bifunctional UDP-N-acetylglucosamine diphosphorylase/glucosamine-1-phosphate N-acetyltransferase GlmU [Thioalkalispiraceae bacterium]|jgi:bifunctional UDP-N-acetylglucosamine pyrophosphorylase/glucosamine-1-phosphate N-acetyltransferase